MKGGSGPCLEYSSGWIIGRYKLRGIPCPKHEKVAAALEIIVAEVSLDSTITRPSSEPTAPTNGADHKYDEERRYQQRLDRRDKVEVIKDEKAQRQREELGKQPLPEYFVSPNISPLGSKQIGLKREFD
ncbi:uncharacterized protein LY89DRAFT_741600 [Mollisia scopiformis]|uniref:Uncharacterized protein n=1 Tax=Mollisia scopiformis TaxID=149040 RepID=A0A132B8R3_MOLSC|nr:uncharacterized protein LY89DRAFT_741600 [Mollisia scopiformis]KUJ08761.1 hypothetical protein LY89DRAFT_741600 [Mollisia scopiformis]